MARPRIKIDWEQFDKLAAMFATQVEIAQWFGCSVDTIERACTREKKMGFAEYYDQKASKGRITLRRKQFEVAQSGNITMLIWLGKQHLGQSDKIDSKSSIELDVNLADRIAKARTRAGDK